MKKKIFLDVIFGSKSDYTEDIAVIIEEINQMPDVCVTIYVISCHRHPQILREFADRYPEREGRWVICCGSMAFALPGVLKACFNYLNKKIPVIGVALEGKGPADLEAAMLSISCLPGKSVIMELDADPYVGAEGLRKACIYAINNPVPEMEIKDPPPFFIALTPEKARELFLEKK